MSMVKRISIEEAKRRERAAAAPPPGREPPPHANGHDTHARELELVDWDKLGPPTAQDNLVGGLLGAQQFGMVYGESGSGKSFFTFDMVAHYALGREWMGHKVKGGGVLYIAAEGRGGWANRVEAFFRHHEIDDEERVKAPFQFILENINLGRTGNGDAAAVVRAADRFSKAKDGTSLDVIVVDTMARATPGSNENDAADMGGFVANMDMIRRNTGASPLIVHHSGKNASLGARGHSSLRAAMDLEAEVERTDAGRTMRLRKSRDGGDGEDVGFQLRVVEVGTDDNGKTITSCVVVPAEAIEGRKKARDKAAWEIAAPYLDKALIDYPAHPVGTAFPTNVTFTTWAKFREGLEHAQIIDGESAATRRKQWQRIRDGLRKKGQLVIEGDYCWRPERDAKA
jgi:AAA domain-containing protein